MPGPADPIAGIVHHFLLITESSAEPGNRCFTHTFDRWDLDGCVAHLKAPSIINVNIDESVSDAFLAFFVRRQRHPMRVIRSRKDAISLAEIIWRFLDFHVSQIEHDSDCLRIQTRIVYVDELLIVSLGIGRRHVLQRHCW